MEYLIGVINTAISDSGNARIAFIILSALTVLVLCLSLGFIILGLIDPSRMRILALKKASHSGLSAEKESLRSDQKKTLSQSLAPKAGWQDSQTRVRLANAGFRSESAVSDYYALRFLTAALLPTVVFFGSQYIPEFTSQKIIAASVAALVVGLILPSFILDKLIATRQRALRNAFPDALDMLVVCVEAGLGLQAALLRVADEIQVSHPVLADELHQVNNETRVGVDRIQALRNMAIRTGLEDIRGLVASLDQSMRFGTSIADTLRVYSDEFRDKRLQKAEEMAAKIATKMIFPLTFCMWPSFFVVMIGPAILGVLAVMATR